MVVEGRDESKDYVPELAREHNGKSIRLCFADILGFLKSFAITFEELETAFHFAQVVPEPKRRPSDSYWR